MYGLNIGKNARIQPIDMSNHTSSYTRQPRKNSRMYKNKSENKGPDFDSHKGRSLQRATTPPGLRDSTCHIFLDGSTPTHLACGAKQSRQANFYLGYGARLRALPAYHGERTPLVHAESGHLLPPSPHGHERPLSGVAEISGGVVLRRDHHLAKTKHVRNQRTIKPGVLRYHMHTKKRSRLRRRGALIAKLLPYRVLENDA